MRLRSLIGGRIFIMIPIIGPLLASAGEIFGSAASAVGGLASNIGSLASGAVSAVGSTASAVSSLASGAVSGIGSLFAPSAESVLENYPTTSAAELEILSKSGISGVGNWLSQNSGTIAQLAGTGLGIYQSVENLKTQRELAKLYAKSMGNLDTTVGLTPSFPSIIDIATPSTGTTATTATPATAGTTAGALSDKTLLYILLGLAAILLFRKLK